MPGIIEQLWTAYQKWKSLSESEGTAIRQADWTSVHRTQNEKRELQTEIIHLTDQAQSEISSKSDHQQFDSRLRTIVNELILLETQNNNVLQIAMGAAEQQKRELAGTSNRLRQLHTRYVPSPAPVWQNLT